MNPSVFNHSERALGEFFIEMFRILGKGDHLEKEKVVEKQKLIEKTAQGWYNNFFAVPQYAIDDPKFVIDRSKDGIINVAKHYAELVLQRCISAKLLEETTMGGFGDNKTAIRLTPEGKEYAEEIKDQFELDEDVDP